MALTSSGIINPMSASSSAPWIGRLEAETSRHLTGESSGHDQSHACRVRDLAVRIAATIGADTEVVEAAALLHDVGHATGRAEHAQRGALAAADILSQLEFPPAKIAAVVACIEHHHWQPGRAGDPSDPTLEYQAFADADRLDALGAIGIARAFAFGGAHQRPIWNPDQNAPPQSLYGVSSVHHFNDKLLRLPGDMYTEVGRQLAARRVRVMEEYLRTFYSEWEGNDVKLTALAAEPKPSLGTFPKRSVKIRDRIRRIFAAILQPDPIN
jgi:uncharacterized protein